MQETFVQKRSESNVDEIDYSSDVLTAANFYAAGHSYWGSLTLVFICTPFFARIFVFLFYIGKYLRESDDARLAIQWQEYPKLIWHFPLLHPIRYFAFDFI